MRVLKNAHAGLVKPACGFFQKVILPLKNLLRVLVMRFLIMCVLMMWVSIMRIPIMRFLKKFEYGF